ncbi:MAG: stalk domain-containing protein, partial [Clostridiales bacterium]|nr:stalk domain-containing protein [Clostridiales bacterium]
TTEEYNNSSYSLDVPATLQYNDVFYVPIRAFCEMVGLYIEWDNASRSVYVTSDNINTDNVYNENDTSVDTSVDTPVDDSINSSDDTNTNKYVGVYYKRLNIGDMRNETLCILTIERIDGNSVRYYYDTLSARRVHYIGPFETTIVNNTAEGIGMDSYTSSTIGVNLVFDGDLISVYYAGESEPTITFDINTDIYDQSVSEYINTSSENRL